jgi:class 3 adenylate cyclase
MVERDMLRMFLSRETGQVSLRIPLYFKIAGTCFGVVLVVLAFLGALEYRDQERALEDKFGLTLQHIAQTAAIFVDGDAHERVRRPEDAKGEDFKQLRALLERVRRENTLTDRQIYTLRPAAGTKGGLEFVVMLQERTFIGDPYMPPQQIMRIWQRVLMEGTPNKTPIYEDAYGTFISGLAPIKNREGKVVAVLQVDFDVAQFLAELQRTLESRLWILPASLALALVLALLLARSITEAVRQLVGGTIAVRAGNYDYEVEVHTRDELRTLAEAFNLMLSGLREHFALLKYVPRHTRAVIAEALRSGRGEEVYLAQKRHLAVFFSDIRGFTAMSDRLAPDRIIEMLNIYLRKEAEIIERHSGSIDKFIGDAVMAVFEGPNGFLNAALAAIEIQQALKKLNAQKAFEVPVHVGIGIAGGEVVMGSVGYEDRMEFAVIGRMVNLAARLTSVAGRGEIVVSELAWQTLSTHFNSEQLKGMKLKGFASEITCYRLKVSLPDTPAEEASVQPTG